MCIDNSTFDDCYSEYGGAFYFENTGVLLESWHTYALFQYCHADKGGAFYLENARASLETDHEIKFHDCYAEYGGVAYYDAGAESCFSISQDNNSGLLSIYNCTATEDGGVCYSEGDTYIFDANVHDCSAKRGGVLFMNGDRVGCFLRDNFYDCTAEQGGVLYCTNEVETVPFESWSNTYTNSGRNAGSLVYCKNDIFKYNNDTVNSDNYYATYVGEHYIYTGFILGSGSVWIVAAGAVLVIGGLVAILIVKKKKAA